MPSVHPHAAPVGSLALTVSSVVTAPEGSASRPHRTAPLTDTPRGRLSRDFLLGLLGAIVLAVVEFVAGGGNALAPNTWVQVGLLMIAAAAAIAALLVAAPGRAWGAGVLAAFAALAALTYASIGWSVQPATSWLEGNRTLSYLAAFAAALLLARLMPGRWRSLLGAVATATTLACGYALLVKVFPGTLDPRDLLGRLRAPFDYWNAVGLVAAMGLPACLWSGTREASARVLRTLSVPAVAILVAAVVLSFSRGAVLVAVIAVGVWFCLAPLRLRSAVVLLAGGIGGGVIAAWGAAHRGISADYVSPASRVSDGHSFGVVIVVALVLTLVAGIGVTLALDRVRLTPAARRRVGTLLVGLVALVPVAGVAALVNSSRGLTGEVSHLWHKLTNANGGVSDQPGRLAQLSNSRPHYWSLAIKVGEHHPLVGAGAGGFAIAQARYGADASKDRAANAHGYVLQTFADLGAVGLAFSLVALVAWLRAAARTLEFAWGARRPSTPRPPPTPEHSAERSGLLALLAIVVTFGVHSLIDWTWFIPGDAVLALVCAGWLAGRGPISNPVGRLAKRRELLRSPALVGGIAALAVVTLAAVWGIAQPLRSSDSDSAAITAALHGDGATALADARAGASEDPVSIDPPILLSTLYTKLNDPSAARSELLDAVSRQPSNPESWQQLGCFDLGRNRPGLAATELHRVLVLDPAKTDPAASCTSP